MKKWNVLATSTLSSALLLASQSTFAAGFQIDAQSATGVGRAYAGDGIIADNASVMAINPASMALFKKTSFSMGGTIIRPMIEVKSGQYNSKVNDNSGSVDYDDAGDIAFAPNIFLVVPLNDKWAVGGGLYSNFGTASSFDSSFPGEYGGDSSIISVDLALAASYRLNDQWSFGAGLDFIYGHGEFKRDLDVNLFSIFPNYQNKHPLAHAAFCKKTGCDGMNKQAADVDATGYGIGWNVGTTFELDENNRWGISYHWSPTITADGKFDGAVHATGADEIDVQLPSWAQFSGYNRIAGTRFAVHYTIQWTDWSVFDKLRTNGDRFTDELETFEWRDTWHYGLGGTFYMNDKWTFRAGYMFDQGAQDGVTTIAVPDSNRHWLSTGFTYALSDTSSIDFGFTYLLGEDVHVHQDRGISNIDAETHTDAIVTGLQFNKTF
ncbi:MAG: outer membrane protein transport protein [Vibrio sp.]